MCGRGLELYRLDILVKGHWVAVHQQARRGEPLAARFPSPCPWRVTPIRSRDYHCGYCWLSPPIVGHYVMPREFDSVATERVEV